MANYYAMNQTMIKEPESPSRWVVSDSFLKANCPGVTIEYQEFLEGEWITMQVIEMDVDAARVLIQILSKIKL